MVREFSEARIESCGKPEFSAENSLNYCRYAVQFAPVGPRVTMKAYSTFGRVLRIHGSGLMATGRRAATCPHFYGVLGISSGRGRRTSLTEMSGSHFTAIICRNRPPNSILLRYWCTIPVMVGKVLSICPVPLQAWQE